MDSTRLPLASQRVLAATIPSMARLTFSPSIFSIDVYKRQENTCYYIKTLTEDFPLAVDVLTDMFLNSKFDNEEIVKEREVIIEEIKMYEDTPDDLVQDLLSANLWPNHPLGRAILGTEESIAAVSYTHLVGAV